MLIKYTLKFWVLGGHVTAADARAFSRPTSKARERRAGDEVAHEAGLQNMRFQKCLDSCGKGQNIL